MSATATTTASSAIRANLSHPVIDCDGHWIEPLPVLLDHVRALGGTSMAATVEAMVGAAADWYRWTPEERGRQRATRPPWWGWPGDTLDHATAMAPRLLHRRLDDFGIDFAIVIGSLLPLWARIEDPAIRKVAVRASNLLHAEMFAEVSDRMTPAAIIAVTTPDEAIEEARFVVEELGLKVAVINGCVSRPIPAHEEHGAAAGRYVDGLGLDSAYDYDALWAELDRLRLSPMSHSPGMGSPDRSSPSNFTFNHVGHFAQAGHAFARSVFLGGVTQRFPELKFAFLEGGVGWARSLVCDLMSHWDKRNRTALLANLSPANLDVDDLIGLLRAHGGRWYDDLTDEQLTHNFDPLRPGLSIDELVAQEAEGELDDFAAVGAHSAEEVGAAFACNFYFGCEADDPMTTLAFDRRFGVRLKPLFSSDISHFDVTVMADVLAEAFELVEDGFLTEDDFRAFTFGNVVELHGARNPAFFAGTVVADAVREELGHGGGRA